MAGRNRKNIAEYFSHDADASSDEKIIFLESQFGHMGYAVYFKFLERMTRSDNFELEWNDIKKAIYASEFRISVTEIDQIVSECCRNEIKAFQIEEGKLFSAGLKKRMQPLLEKREYNRQKYEEKKTKENSNLCISVTENSVSVDEMTQRKGKERKGKDNNTPHIPQKGKDVELKDFFLKNIPEDLSFLQNNLLEFFKYRQQKPKSKRYQSEIGINGLFRDICNCIAVGHPPVECLNIAMERGWQTPSPDYFKPEMFTKLTNGTVQETKEQILKRHGLSA